MARQRHEEQRRGDERRQDEVIEEGMDRRGGKEARQERRKPVGMPIGQGLRDDGQDGRRGAVEDRRAQPSHDPEGDARLGDRPEVLDVLDHGEGRSHGEAEDGRVHEEADPASPDEPHDERALERLFGDGCQVARELDGGHVPQIQQ